tara:strand:+ start:2356 stop:2625 length:270 start_codon:yes stop_codon:yes gene_type:complete
MTLLVLIGVFLYLLSYVLLTLDKIDGNGNGKGYLTISLAAASCVLCSIVELFNGPSLMIQGMWILLSIYGISKIWIRENKEKAILSEQR